MSGCWGVCGGPVSGKANVPLAMCSMCVGWDALSAGRVISAGVSLVIVLGCSFLSLSFYRVMHL